MALLFPKSLPTGNTVPVNLSKNQKLERPVSPSNVTPGNKNIPLSITTSENHSLSIKSHLEMKAFRTH